MSNNPIYPNSIRVWRGFRNQEHKNDVESFYKKLGSVFVPITRQVMTPMGLESYIATVLPNTSFALPDEVALVGYKTAESYIDASQHSVIGRGYGSLHSTLFNFDPNGDIPPSRSAFPDEFPGNTWQWGAPYYFNGSPVDWVNASVITNVFVLSTDEEQARFKVTEILLQVQRGIEVNLAREAISVAENGYLIVWLNNLDVSHRIFEVSDYDYYEAQKLEVKPIWTRPDPGVSVVPGHSYNVVLEQP